MNPVTSIRVQHFRAHQDLTLEVSPGVTVVTGPNGSGKTSLVEALYVALRGSSFKGTDKDILSFGQSWYRIDTKWADRSVRTVKFDSQKQSGRKQFSVDGKTHYRLSPQYRYPAVLFDPDDLRLLHGSPARRREFIDRLISQLDHKYAVALSRYERALRQRNALLKQEVNDDALFVWDMALSENGGYIMQRRAEYIHELNSRLQDMYRSIAHTNDVINVVYSYEVKNTVQQHLLHELHSNARRDKITGFTSAGPHRHDVIFSFNNTAALNVASRGEVRSVVLALKFLEVDLLAKVTGNQPIILLDDVFSELDTTRQASLASGILKNQTIITTATAVDIKNAKLVKL